MSIVMPNESGQTVVEVEKVATQPANHDLDLRKAMAQQLASLRRAGLTHLPKGSGEHAVEFSELPTDSVAAADSVKEASAKSLRSQAPASSADSPTPDMDRSGPPESSTGEQIQTTLSRSTDGEAYGPSRSLGDRTTALNVLGEEIAGCTKCEELSSKRTQTVFGVGNPAARLVFVGEGPGFHEDRVGEPFVGDAGEQLNKIIKACKLTRDEVYILNAVKCRPPGNRNPNQTELSNCWNYAEQQLEILQPEFIVCLGSVAAKTLLKTTLSLGRLRKQFHSYRGSRVLVTYHPAYLLRTPSAKRHVWEDMKMLMQEMGIDWTK